MTSGSPTATPARRGWSSAPVPAAAASRCGSTDRRSTGRRRRPGPRRAGSPPGWCPSKQTITVTEADGSEATTLRRIRLDLDQPTRDKEKGLSLLTDVPRERADARRLAEVYRDRWRPENVFRTLTEALVCEIDTLAYPKAALFGFSVASVAYDVLATVRAALRSEHGREAVESGASNYHLANEVATTYEGMMIAVPPSEWTPLGRLSLSESADFLREVASQAWLAKYPRTVRGPKKPPPRRTSGRTNHHVSTARLLHKQSQQK